MSRITSATAAVRDRVQSHPRIATVLGLAALIGFSYLLRSQALWAKFWIDEGLSVGIASHDFADIPSVLQKDGAPPAYYLLLHLWIDAIGGAGEARTHALSLLCALLAIPAAWWGGRKLFGTPSGWAAAAMAATLPFLTYYAQETRMYALAVLVGIVLAAAFAGLFALRDRRMLPAFVLFGALAPYVHNWGLFMLLGCGAAWVALTLGAETDERSKLVRDGLTGFGLIALLYLPWLPTLLGQAAETGAPWAEKPDLESIVSILEVTVGAGATSLAIALVGGTGLLRMRAAEPERARAAAALLIILLTGVLVAWVASQVSPAWSGRYVAILVGPTLLLASAGLTRAGTLGVVTLAVVLVLWADTQERQIKGKSDAFKVARTLEDRGLVRDGDTVLAVHPEQGPVMRYYLGDGLRWADALGPVEDPQVFDWRNALERLERTGPKAVMREVAPGIEPGERLIVVLPIVRSGRWGAPWTSLVRRRSAQWQRALDHDRRFERVDRLPAVGYRRPPRGVRVVVYERR